MTNSVYTLSAIKKSPSTIDEPEYMDINADEAEAGSILMSLSQHTKRNERSATTHTMSIRNLLDNDEHGTSHQEQSKMDGQVIADSSKSTIEAVKEGTHIPQAYANGMHDQHPASTVPPLESFTSKGSQSERYQQWPNYKARRHSYYQHEWYPQHHQYPHHLQQQQHPYQQQPIKKPYSRSHPQQQRRQSMRKQVRPSALHVYISYLTYSDLKRKKSNIPHLQQQHGSQLVAQVQTPSMPMSKQPTAPTLSSTQHLHHHHHQPPLTAFLKDTAPTTPIPKSSLPPIEPHRPSADWQDRRYHSSPPPPPSHYRHPYPTTSFPTK